MVSPTWNEFCVQRERIKYQTNYIKSTKSYMFMYKTMPSEYDVVEDGNSNISTCTC